MFSGQGSQYYQMAADLYAGDAAFRAAMDRCSAHAAPALGTSLTHLIFQPRADRFAPFDRTLHTHPALFSIQFSLAQSLLARGRRPDRLLGYSLGEWVAQAVAGALAPETALDLLIAQARLVESATPAGGMLAVVAPETIRDEQPAIFDRTWVAAHNFNRHFVVSGLTAEIDAADAALRAQGVTTQRVPVSRPFHSPYMDAIQPAHQAALHAVTFQPPAMPIVSCRGVDVTAADPADTLWRAAREPMAFTRTVAMLEAAGAPTYVDCGPSGTLATFVKYNLPRDAARRAVPLITPFGHNVERVDAWARTTAPGDPS